ncbi:hypothetical protein Tco_0735991 [Tanacetum coccineum]
MIPTVSPTIPLLPNYTPASPDYSPASDTKFNPSEDPSSDHIPPLPATSPFLSSTGDSSDNDIPDTPPSPTHGTPFTEMTRSTQSTPVASGALQHQISSSSSSSKTSSDPSSDDLSDSSSNHSLPAPSSGMRPSHHLCSLVLSIHRSSAAIFERPSHDSSSASPSRKRSRSPAAFVPLSSPIPRTLSFARADLLPSPKRIMSHESATDLEVSSVKGSEPSRYRGTDLDDVERSDGIDIDPEIQAEIDKCIAYADALRVREIDARVVVEPAQEEGAVEVTYKTLRDLVQRIVATGQQSADMLERICKLERDNRRLRDMMDVASQRVTRSQRRELRVQREMRQIQHFRFYDRMRVARLKACTRRHLGYLIVIMTIPNSRSGASRTCEGFNEQIDRQLAGALRARVAARNLEPLIGGGGEQEEISRNGGSRNGGNGNRGNENGGGNGYNFEGIMLQRDASKSRLPEVPTP